MKSKRVVKRVHRIGSVSTERNFEWQPLRRPSDFKRKELPTKAGLYRVVVCDNEGKPKLLPGQPPNTRTPGVVYIGLTGSRNTLKGRFNDVLRSWRPRKKWPKKWPHGSRKHYEDDPKAKALFSPNQVWVQYQTLPTDLKDDHPDVVAFAQKHGMTAEEYRDIVGLKRTGDRRVADSEAIAIQAFLRENGYIPMLNRDEEGRGDKPPTDDEMAEILKNPETPTL